MFKVYLVTNLLNGKVYVGKTSRTLERRWVEHCSEANTKSNVYFHNAIRKHGKENFDIQEIACPENEQSANNLEMVYIILFRSDNPNFGYNSTSGGEGSFHNDATKKKISAALVGKPGHPMSEDNKQKLMAAVVGVPKSEEHKQKISETRKQNKYAPVGFAAGGYNHTEESKLKMSLRRRGENNARYRHDVSDEEVVNLYMAGNSLREVADELNIGMTTVRRRLAKTGTQTRPVCIHISNVTS